MISPENDPRFCNIKGTFRPQLIVFMIAMILIGCGGTPIFVLGNKFTILFLYFQSQFLFLNLYL